jgi:hypothetical protein
MVFTIYGETFFNTTSRYTYLLPTVDVKSDEKRIDTGANLRSSSHKQCIYCLERNLHIE